MNKGLGAVGVSLGLLLGLISSNGADYAVLMSVRAVTLTVAGEGGMPGSDAGKSAVKACLVCHSVNQGGAHKSGPNLWGIVGAKVAASPGFTYSDALKQSGGVWSSDRLDQFIDAPAKFYPGSNMKFSGIKNEEKRKEIILYLRTLK